MALEELLVVEKVAAEGVDTLMKVSEDAPVTESKTSGVATIGIKVVSEEETARDDVCC